MPSTPPPRAPKLNPSRGCGWPSRRQGTCDAAIGMHCGAGGQWAEVPDPPELNAQGTDPMLAFFRFLAGVLLLIAVIAAVYDGTRSVAAGALVSTPLAEHWSKIAPGLLSATQSAVSRTTHPLVWELGMRKVLLVPTWALFAVLGLLFAFAGRRRRRIDVFVN